MTNRSPSDSAAAGFLLGRIDYERTPPSGSASGTFRLARMEELLKRLGNPHREVPCVHIAGSKGKGSTAAMTAAIISAAGHRTGLFTSPHITHFEERIQIDGRSIPSVRFAELVEQLRPVAEEMDGGPLGGPTFFELTTALAWMHFVAEQVDVVVLEVGLGGRLDATNLCRPLVSIITSISRDHVRILGETSEEIAAEKAGIIKPGVKVLTGVQAAGPLEVIHGRARALGAELLRVGHEIRLDTQQEDGDAASGRLVRRSIDLSNPWRSHRHLPVPLPGRHQALNAALAVTAADLLHHESLLRVPAAAVQSGLSAVRWPLRTEVLGNHPLVIVDAAHNEASIAALVETLSETSAGRRIVIFAASRDKDASAMLAQLRPAADVLILTRFLGNPRAISIEDLQRLCGDRHEGSLLTAEDPAAALQTALQLATQDDLICATGSFFLAAEVRTAWELVHGPAMP